MMLYAGTREPSGPVARRETVETLEGAREVQLVGVANLRSDLGDRHGCELEELRGLVHAIANEMLLGSPAGCFLENLPKVARVEPCAPRDVRNGDVLAIVSFHILECRTHMDVLEFA